MSRAEGEQTGLLQYLTFVTPAAGLCREPPRLQARAGGQPWTPVVSCRCWSVKNTITLGRFRGGLVVMRSLPGVLRGEAVRPRAAPRVAQPGEVCDGRYVYMRAAPEGSDNEPLFHYTHMPTAMRGFVSLDSLRRMEVAPPFSFTKECPTMKLPTKAWVPVANSGTEKTLLWDVRSDPHQESPLLDGVIEARMTGHLIRLMAECDAPAEQYARLGLTPDAAVANTLPSQIRQSDRFVG
jgi:hypothetical protein